jgi:hypothetical protein
VAGALRAARVRVLVCGGRDYFDQDRVDQLLDKIHDTTPITELCQGGAAGADALGKRWAIKRGIPHVEYPANWKEHGKVAGPIRNNKMLREFKPDLVVAFPGGRGTGHMVSISERAKVDVLVVPAYVIKEMP